MIQTAPICAEKTSDPYLWTFQWNVMVVRMADFFSKEKFSGDVSFTINFHNLWQIEQNWWETDDRLLWMCLFCTVGNFWTLGKIFSGQEIWMEKVKSFFFYMEREDGSWWFLLLWIERTFRVKKYHCMLLQVKEKIIWQVLYRYKKTR